MFILTEVTVSIESQLIFTQIGSYYNIPYCQVDKKYVQNNWTYLVVIIQIYFTKIEQNKISCMKTVNLLDTFTSLRNIKGLKCQIKFTVTKIAIKQSGNIK